MSTDTKQTFGFVKTVTWILSFGLLIVIALESFGAFDHMRKPSPEAEYELTALDLVAASDGTAYIVSANGEVWHVDGALRRKVPGIPQEAYITELVVTGSGDVYAAGITDVWHIANGSATLVRAQGRGNF